MERKRYLVVTAGGTGTRMGTTLPKQFLSLGGRAVLQRTIEQFLKACPDIRVITVLPEGHMAWWRRYCRDRNFNCPQRLVPGGFTRFHSVKNALEYVPDGAIVAVHDAVRPLLSVDLIRTMFERMDTARRPGQGLGRDAPGQRRERRPIPHLWGADAADLSFGRFENRL